jgi:hypothetical protein
MKLEANSKMRSALAALPSVPPELPEELRRMVSQGFLVKGGCALLTSLHSDRSNLSQSDFQDSTGYECAVNSLHIEDYASGKDLLGIALQFILVVLRAWNVSPLNSGQTLLGVTSSNDENYVVKFHLRREGQSWLAADLNSYDQQVFALQSVEVD